MLICKNCNQLFVSILIIAGKETCPYCGGNRIAKAVSPFKNGIPEVDPHRISQEAFENGFDDAYLDDAADCNCDGDCENCEVTVPNQNLELPAFEPEVSFHDLDVNEVCLLGLNIPKESRPTAFSYITRMQERFLHTFIDGSFVPD